MLKILVPQPLDRLTHGGRFWLMFQFDTRASAPVVLRKLGVIHPDIQADLSIRVALDAHLNACLPDLSVSTVRPG